MLKIAHNKQYSENEPTLKLLTARTPNIIIGKKKGIARNINSGPLEDNPNVNAEIGIPIKLNRGVPSIRERNNPNTSL